MIDSRSPIATLGIRAASPLALLVAAFVFFGGHNRPGGGFAAGLLIGAVVALRRVAGLHRHAGSLPLLTVGGVLAGSVALAPVVVGHAVLDQVVVTATIPLLGTVKSGSALVFDSGVTLIVVGLVVAVLDGLGASELGGSTPTEPELP